MKKIGLTGSIGAGKSTVAECLRKYRIPVHDADLAVHEIYKRPEIQTWLNITFPGAIQRGDVNRARLAEMIYADPEVRKHLESKIHPLVREHARTFMKTAESFGEERVVFDIPLLFENGRDTDMDETWLVTAPPEIRCARLMARTAGMTMQKFYKIDSAQMSEAEKRERATHVIENDGTIEELQQKIKQLLGN